MEKSERHSSIVNLEGDTDERVDWEDFVVMQGNSFIMMSNVYWYRM
jgi:hypothetical protein